MWLQDGLRQTVCAKKNGCCCTTQVLVLLPAVGRFECMQSSQLFKQWTSTPEVQGLNRIVMQGGNAHCDAVVLCVRGVAPPIM
jgi:hypothetical protein